MPELRQDSLNLPASSDALILLFGAIGASLLVAGGKGYPYLHLILDTSVSLLSLVLTLLLWDVGKRLTEPFAKWLAISFAAVSALELVHVMVTIEWSGVLAPVTILAPILRPLTWPPAAYALPIGIGAALWLHHRGSDFTWAFGAGVAAIAVGLLWVFQFVPPYFVPGFLGISRPSLVLVPLLWTAIATVCWRGRDEQRKFAPLAAMACVLAIGHVAMLYSRSPHDLLAMVAHLGKTCGYLILLLALLRTASVDMQERISAESQLARANERLERRVTERTAELAATNAALESAIGASRAAESKAQAQLGRLSLLHGITSAIGERQDLGSVFQVVVASLERELPVAFCCICLYDRVDQVVTVSHVGAQSGSLALELAMPERARIAIDENGLSRSVRGQLVYEPDISLVDFPFPQRLARGGLRSLVVAPLQVEGQVFGVLIVARNASEGFSSGECEFLLQLSRHVALAAHQAELHSALQRAYDDLRQTQQAIMQQERLRALGQMASGVAHDVNNSLSPISLYTQLLLENDQTLSTKARGYLETVQRAAEDIAHTVARMSDFYRQREPQLVLVPLQLNLLMQQVMDLTRARWSDIPLRRGTVIEVTLEAAPSLPVVLGIESEIREALVNLVINAVDAMPDGGSLTLRTSAKEGGFVDVEVSDTGMGMDEETRIRCLEPFFTTKGERGTGLGLAMVYGIAQRNGAEVRIASAIGEGTTVALRFEERTTVSTVLPTLDVSSRAGARLRLLVVDDDPVILKSLSDALEGDGHVVTAVHDGQSGIDAFLAVAATKAFDAVITDLGMPRIDGRKVAAFVKERAPQTPVILLTGWGRRMLSDEETPAHVDRVLSKPPKIAEIRTALAQLCSAQNTDGPTKGSEALV